MVLYARVPYVAAESDWRSAIVELAKSFGWVCHFTWNSRHSPAGWPDLVLIRPPRLIVVELKVGKNRLTDRQIDTLRDLAACGVETRIWRHPESWDDVIATLVWEGAEYRDGEVRMPGAVG